MIRLILAFLSGLFLRSLVERWYRDAVEELADAEVERRTNVSPLTPRERQQLRAIGQVGEWIDSEAILRAAGIDPDLYLADNAGA